MNCAFLSRQAKFCLPSISEVIVSVRPACRTLSTVNFSPGTKINHCISNYIGQFRTFNPLSSPESHEVGFSNRGGLLSFCALENYKFISWLLFTIVPLICNPAFISTLSTTHCRHVFAIYCSTAFLRFAQLLRVRVPCVSSTARFFYLPCLSSLKFVLQSNLYKTATLYQAASFQSPDFSLIQTLYLLPVLGGRGHRIAVPCLSFFVIFTCIKRPHLNGN